MPANDVIVALATPPGRSGVAVLRLSGPDLRPAMNALTLPTLVPRHATLVSVRNTTGETIDRGLALFFPGPASFTGEDVLELQLHGSTAVIRETLSSLLSIPGHRAAEPGEFARRAFESGKLDLSEVEGLADLIDAETSAQRRQALRQMEGALGETARRLRESLLEASAYCEALIDFSDDDLPSDTANQAELRIEAVMSDLAAALENAQYGERLRSGFRVTLIGAPNVGKSTLINALARRDVAIVSPVAGTTRDLVEIELDLDGLPVRFVDTAGIRISDDPVEEEGIRRARSSADQSDLVLWLDDGTGDESAVPGLSVPLWRIRTKADLDIGANIPSKRMIAAKTGHGISDLLEEITRYLTGLYPNESAILTQERHTQLFQRAFDELSLARSLSIELKAHYLRTSIDALSGVTGNMTNDDLLDTIFSRFCLGK